MASYPIFDTSQSCMRKSLTKTKNTPADPLSFTKQFEIENRLTLDPVAVPQTTTSLSEKEILCQQIYDKLIKKISGKITGMFKDGLDTSDLQSIIDEPDISKHEWFNLALKALLE